MDEATRIQLPQGFVPSGTRLSGIYEIDAPLAKGGMGEVYRGHAIETGDPVAIKLIRADMADNEAALALFRREASALNRLHHEAIVRYYVFTLDPMLQRHYLAMELVEGVALSVLIGRGPLSVADAHRLLQRIAAGLQAAHERSIVHRDMSPDNVIVEDGDVTHSRIIDFGIARSTRVGDATVIGSGFAGKYNYVSPEQLGLFGGEVTGKSDIYSLGLVIAQCLLGKPIDMGGSQVDLVDKRRVVPDLAGVDARMRPILERMLQPNPADRPASMAEIAATPLPAESRQAVRQAAKNAAREASAGRKTAAPIRSGAPIHAGGSTKWVVATVAGLGLLAVGGGLFWLNQSAPSPIGAGQPAPSVSLAAAPPTPALRPSPTPAPTPVAPATQPPTATSLPSVASPPAPSAPQPPQQQAAVSPPPSRILVPPAPLTPTERLQRYIRDYNGGDCFLVMATAVSAASAEIDAFASDTSRIDSFDKDFAKANGWEAQIAAGPVAPGQCNAVRYVKRLRADGNAGLAQLSLAREVVKSGQNLEGALTSAMPNVGLFLIGDDGKAHDASTSLVGDGPRRSFSLRMDRFAATRNQPNLLLAIASARPLGALRLTGAAPTGDLLTAAIREAANGSGVEVAMKFFTLD